MHNSAADGHTGSGDGMNSLWNKTVKLPSFPRLEKDLRTDVLIIGGGIAGLLCAYMLDDAGVDYALVESGRIADGTTGNTTAKITVQHGAIYHRLIRQYGEEKAMMYYRANAAALAQYRALASKIDCDFLPQDSVIYSCKSERDTEAERKACERLGIPARACKDLSVPVPVKGAVCIPEQAQFHPRKFIAGIIGKLKIYEHTAVRAYDGSQVCTDRGKISASRIIVTTHFPIFNKHGAYFLKMYQDRSYVLALENTAPLYGMLVDEDSKGLSFRTQDDLLLLGGGAHRTGKQGGNWKELESFIRKHYPSARERYRWAAQDCMTLDGIPYIGEYSREVSGLYVATGFNKWGMTSSMAAAMILRDMILGRDPPWAPVFSPSRSILHPQLLTNIWESGIHLLTPTTPRCPHLGCALKWNPQERSWDCPCHGSRFAADGTLLNDPATGDLDL